jgi:hypothetical protein
MHQKWNSEATKTKHLEQCRIRVSFHNLMIANVPFLFIRNKHNTTGIMFTLSTPSNVNMRRPYPIVSLVVAVSLYVHVWSLKESFDGHHFWNTTEKYRLHYYISYVFITNEVVISILLW